jgi:hypothetical protein
MRRITGPFMSCGSEAPLGVHARVQKCRTGSVIIDCRLAITRAAMGSSLSFKGGDARKRDRHMSEKEWMDMPDFVEALRLARKRWTRRSN